jgi:CBS domain containing-hemolysin-like protein
LVPRVQTVAIQQDETLQRLAQLALESGHSRFPVYNEDIDDIVGLANVMDIFRFSPEERATKRITEIMREALIVPESIRLDQLLTRMRRERQQLSVVIDEYGGTAGIVTVEDLLEEIVGEIEDEYDVDVQERQTSPVAGVHRVSGMLHSDELREATGFEMPEGDYDTLAGFLLSLFDHIPQKGEQVSYNGWEFKVLEMDRNRISEVLMIAPAEDQQEVSSEKER